MACINGETSNLFVVLATINNSPNWHRIESDVNFVEAFQVALLYKCNRAAFVTTHSGVCLGPRGSVSLPPTPPFCLV